MTQNAWPSCVALAAAVLSAGTAHAQQVGPPSQTPPHMPPAPVAETSWSSGSPRTSEGDRHFKINGRVQYDVLNISTDGLGAADQDYTRAFARRAFLGVEGQFTENWKYNIKFAYVPGAEPATTTTTTLRLCQDNATAAIVQRSSCLAGETDRGPIVTAVSTSGGADEVGFDDAFIQYVVGDWEFTLGQNNRVSPMEDITSSLNIPFNERSGMINAFGFAKTMGFAVNTSGKNWSAGVGVYGDDLANPEVTNQSEAVSLNARGTWAPVYERTPDGLTFIHLGLNARIRDNSGGPDSSGNRGAGFRYRARPQSGYGDRFVDTGPVAFAQDQFLGAEFAAQHNQFAMAAEYGRLTAKPQSGTGLGSFEPTFQGGYVDLFWSPTGDSRNYNIKDGTFGRSTPRRALGSNGGIGSIMLGLRYDYLDLTDGAVDGGEQRGVTAQATWQPLSFLKFQADYSRLDIERPNSPLSGEADVVTIRSQIEW